MWRMERGNVYSSRNELCILAVTTDEWGGSLA